MPRNISFAMTTDQIRQRIKTVTRRLGWKNLKPGTVLQAIVKGQGLKKGEKVEKLCLIRALSVRSEPLSAIGDAECTREGFPGMRREAFIKMFMEHNGCEKSQPVTRIEFEYVEGEGSS